MKCLIFAALIAASVGLTDMESAILALTGASQIEELDEEVMERYRSLAAHPLDINAAGRAKMISCGLFTRFQAASIIDCRENSGDILSFAELALVDGFNEEIVKALRPFIKLESGRAPGEKTDTKLSQEAMARSSVKATDGDCAFAAGVKYGLNWGEKAEFNWASRITYDNQELQIGTVSAAYYGRRHIGKVVLGDFNARFGQGLAAWTGFSLSGLTTVQSFRRNGTGISPTSSFTSNCKGAGVELNFGRWTAGAAYSLSGGEPFANVCWTGRKLSAGLTAGPGAYSADFRAGLPGLSIFSEAGWNGAPMGLLGLVWIPRYGIKTGAVAKFKDGKLQAAAGAEFKCFQANFETNINYTKRTEQYRLTLTGSREWTVGKALLKPSLKLSGKLKPQETSPFRGDIRADLSAGIGNCCLSTRYDAVFGKAFAWQWYLEGSRKTGKSAFYARAALFQVDNWDDRIYVYERDVPGAFNVPAYYGRGWSASLMASVKFGIKSRHALHARLSAVQYFTDKPGKLEAKLQYNLQL